MAGNLRILRDASENLQLREASSEENKKDASGGWDKIPEVVQKMIVRLSASTDDVEPPGPCDSYLRVLKQAKAVDAANLSSCNKTELDLLQSEGKGIPKEMVKKLAENKFKHPETTHQLRHQFNN